jgi:outer membrane protein assembly factor BamE (lipoprotein component of BamABCDE complex)
MYHRIILAVLFICIAAASCHSAASHQKSLPQQESEKFTLGIVQKRVYAGMSQADVAQVLGSPNIVTKDAFGKEAWIYDKVAKEVSYSQDQGGVWLILGGYSKEAGASQVSQKTLTVVIKFIDGLVKDVTYHSSQF